MSKYIKKADREGVINTYQEAINYLENEKGNPNKESIFVCHLLGWEFRNYSALGFFKSEKPSNRKHKEFTQHGSWMGNHAWWCFYSIPYSEVLEEKIKFLKKLITIIKNMK